MGPLPHTELPTCNPCSYSYQNRLVLPHIELSINGAYSMYTCSYLTMLCYFLLYSKINQLCICLYTLFSQFLSHLGYHRALRPVTCATQIVLICFQGIILHNIQKSTCSPVSKKKTNKQTKTQPVNRQI